jgi:uncharacterized protein RhaS with RHS repeats
MIRIPNRLSLALAPLLLLLASSYTVCAWYDPGVQRWINRDPIQEKGGKNLYRFVNNDPNRRVDSFGLEDPQIMNLDWSCLNCYLQLFLQRRKIMGRAAYEAATDPVYGGIGHVDGPEDAIRHCLAGCYLAKAMRAIPACKDTLASEVIADEERNRSNRSQVDIENGIEGSRAPNNSDCQEYCRKAYVERRIRSERPPPWPVRTPGGR